jgi:phosphohistidine phosphatase
MRRLLLLRHAKTERAKPGEKDRDRQLTARGRADAPAIAAYLARHGFAPDLALVSTATRAQQTWALIAPAFPAAPRVVVDKRLYQADPDALMAVIGTAGDAGTLLVVVHNPGLHELALLLVGAGDIEARQRLGEGLPTSGLAVIDFARDDWSRLHPNAGRLERFISPRALAAATD